MHQAVMVHQPSDSYELSLYINMLGKFLNSPSCLYELDYTLAKLLMM